MTTGNLAVTAILATTLRGFDNDHLSALNLMINGFGKATIGTKAYHRALELEMIRADGTPQEKELSDALAYEVNCRVEEGTFK